MDDARAAPQQHTMLLFSCWTPTQRDRDPKPHPAIITGTLLELGLEPGALRPGLSLLAPVFFLVTAECEDRDPASSPGHPKDTKCVSWHGQGRSRFFLIPCPGICSFGQVSCVSAQADYRGLFLTAA